MFYTGANYSKLKTNLKLAINRLKLLEKKKTELALKSRKEISTYLANYKIERAKIRVEHIIREDYVVEAMETIEMFCDLLLARFGLIQQMKAMDPGIEEAISSILWAAPRLQTDIPELKVISEQFASKYGKLYHKACMEGSIQAINKNLMQRLSVEAPPMHLVDSYLSEIAKSHNVPYESDLKVEEFTGELLKFDDDEGRRPPNVGPSFPGSRGGGGGYGEIGFVDAKNSGEFPQVPSQVQHPFAYHDAPFIPGSPCPPPPPYFSVDLKPVPNGAKGVQPPSNPSYDSLPSYNSVPKPPRSSANAGNVNGSVQSSNSSVLPELPDVPDSVLPNASEPDEPNFDDLAARFDALKRLK